MSGHSKWATIKHKKGAADAKRGKLFAKLIRQVEVAARSGGGDPDMNPTLRTMYQKARDASVPLDTIERAIKRGTGELEGVNYEEIAYEGYGPNGVAVYVEALTDNRNRTGPEIKAIFSKQGGSIAEPGAVAWQFERRGVVRVPASVDEDELTLAAVEAGADDLRGDTEGWTVVCDPADTHRGALSGRGSGDRGGVLRPDDAAQLGRGARDGGGGHPGAAPHRRTRRPRRHPGRLRELRRPRRRCSPTSRAEPLGPVGSPAVRFVLRCTRSGATPASHPVGGGYWATPSSRLRVTERTPRCRLMIATTQATAPRIHPVRSLEPSRVPVAWL